jgi:hypothetical protein
MRLKHERFRESCRQSESALRIGWKVAVGVRRIEMREGTVESRSSMQVD